MSRAQTSRGRRVGGGAKQKIRPNAELALSSIPGITSADIHSWFYSARILTPADEAYNDIMTYIQVGLVHDYKVKVHEIIHVHRNHDKGFMYDKCLQGKFRMMLWHGTKTAAVAPILRTGLLPPKMNMNQMFGKGIYFADRFAKSANYCGDTTPGAIGYVFLCEVAVGKWYTAKSPKEYFEEPPTLTLSSGRSIQCDSVMSAGKSVPDRREQKTLWNGSLLPYGKTIPNPKFSDCILRYNEFIVYSPEQAKIRFILKVEFTL